MSVQEGVQVSTEIEAGGAMRPEYFENLGKSPSEATGLPGRMYTDPAVFEAEKKKIFRPNWMAIMHQSSIPNPGDYRVVEVLGESFVFVRGEDGEIRGFHNICRHRGAKVSEGEGNCSHFRCPYHLWTYDLKGKLTGAPTMADVINEGVRVKEGTGLLSVRVEVWLGFVFMNLDGKAAPMSETLADLAEAVSAWSSEDVEVLYEIPYQGAWNWKLTWENTIEGYHVMAIHRDTAPASAGQHTYTRTKDEDATHYTDFTIPFASGKNWQNANGDSVRSIPFDNVPDWVEEGARFYIAWPNFQFQLEPGNLTAYLVLPGAGPDEVTFTWINIVRPETLEMDGFEAYKAEEVHSSNLVQAEDEYPCRTMWENMKGDSFVPGPFAHGERAVYHFNQWYMRQLSDTAQD